MESKNKNINTKSEKEILNDSEEINTEENSETVVKEKETLEKEINTVENNETVVKEKEILNDSETVVKEKEILNDSEKINTEENSETVVKEKEALEKEINTEENSETVVKEKEVLKKENTSINFKKKTNFRKTFNRKTSSQNNNTKQNYKKNYRKLINEALKVPIIQIAEKLGLPITSKKTIKCINPSHFDQNSSMFFNEETNMYECFFCGTSGTTIDMVRLCLHITRNKAAEWILDKVEDTEKYKKFIPEDRKKTILTSKTENIKTNYKKTYNLKKKNTKSTEINKEKEKIFAERKKLFQSHDIQKMYWMVKNNLMPISKIRIGISFIKEKNIRTETMDNLEIGIIANSSGLEKELRRRYKTDELIAAGLYSKRKNEDNSTHYYFTFKEHNVIFPYFSGRMIVFLQGRRIDNKEPIYITSNPGQPFIYNYNLLRNLKEKDTLIICTDIIETISLLDKGFSAINVINAKRFKNDWVQNIQSKNIILVTNDTNAQKHLGSIFSRNKINIKIADYNKIISSSKKKLKEIGEFFKYNPSEEKDNTPFWKKTENK